ncbi:MAG TPA: Fic family protein [Bacteroidia bacterium]|nr:Fic family protein [Bacteroidia bacterium]
MSTLDELTRLRDEWQALQPIQPEDEQRLWRKLKLEWNYHSNHIEGNTLTYGETELLLIHEQTSGDHPLRDYIEMQAHDLAIGHLRMIAGDSQRPLSESDIRNLNHILLKESFWKDAIAPDGMPTRIEILPGEYKAQPNNVRTASGEIFRFADPVEVPARMAAMLSTLHRAMGEAASHPVEIASWLHHEFVLIHPFGDGNGRTARLLVNYVLMRSGYLPLIVPTERKDSYLAALRLADAGDRSTLTAFLAECSKLAMQRGIRAAKGESIEEDGDLEKEIELFKRRNKPTATEIVARSPEVVERLYRESIHPLCFEFIKTLSKLDGLFLHSSVKINSVKINTASLTKSEDLPNAANFSRGNAVRVNYTWGGFTGDGNGNASESVRLEIFMQEFGYSIYTPGFHSESRPYSLPILESERQKICRNALAAVFERIKSRVEKDDAKAG